MVYRDRNTKWKQITRTLAHLSQIPTRTLMDSQEELEDNAAAEAKKAETFVQEEEIHRWRDRMAQKSSLQTHSAQEETIQ